MHMDNNDKTTPSGNNNAPPTFGDDWQQFAREASSAFESLTTNASDLVRSASARAQTSTATMARTASNAAADANAAVRALSRERVVWFLALGGTSVFFYTLAFVVGVPTLVFAPAKFGLCFSLGSACSISAVGALRGASGQLTHMTTEERLPASAAVVLTMFMTLRAALWNHSYVMTVFWSLLQAVAVGYNQVTYFPYGAQGARTVASVAYQIAQPVCGGCFRALGIGGRERSSVLPV